MTNDDARMLNLRMEDWQREQVDAAYSKLLDALESIHDARNALDKTHVGPLIDMSVDLGKAKYALCMARMNLSRFTTPLELVSGDEDSLER